MDDGTDRLSLLFRFELALRQFEGAKFRGDENEPASELRNTVVLALYHPMIEVITLGFENLEKLLKHAGSLLRQFGHVFHDDQFRLGRLDQTIEMTEQAPVLVFLVTIGELGKGLARTASRKQANFGITPKLGQITRRYFGYTLLNEPGTLVICLERKARVLVNVDSRNYFDTCLQQAMGKTASSTEKIDCSYTVGFQGFVS